MAVDVALAITLFLKAAKFFYDKIYHFFKVRGQLLEQFKKCSKQMNKINTSLEKLENRLEKKQDLTQSLQKKAEDLVEEIKKLVVKVNKFHIKLQTDSKFSLCSNEETLISHIKTLEADIENIKDEIISFYEAYGDEFDKSRQRNQEESCTTLAVITRKTYFIGYSPKEALKMSCERIAEYAAA